MNQNIIEVNFAALFVFPHIVTPFRVLALSIRRDTLNSDQGVL